MMLSIKRPDAVGGYCLSKKRKMNSFLVAVGIFVFLSISSSVVFASSDAENGPKGWVKEDSYRIMNFVVLAVGLFFVLRKPVTQGLSGRIKDIEEQLTDLELRKKDAEDKLKQHNDSLSALDEEAAALMKEYLKQGNDAKARILAEAALVADKLQAQAKRNVEQEFKLAKNKIMDKILHKALVGAEEKIREKITETDHNRLIDEYLEKVVA